MKRVLMIAYHFPPLAGSSGIQRTLRFVQHLPRFGWEPLVLSAHPRAYERVSTDLDAEIPAGTVVRRAFALDTARHLALGGRYLGALARPDRWQSWRFGAIPEGLRMVRAFRPDALWSTYPIATAHLIGHALQQRSGLPWIADFRDPMAQPGYPADPRTWQHFDRIERAAVAAASWSVFATPGAARTYRERYAGQAARIRVIENGYDEESFAGAAPPGLPAERSARSPGPLVLLHSGIVYPSERDPSALFDALASLQARGLLSPADLRIRFRAAVHDTLISQMAAARGVAAFVELAPAVPYRDALAEMLRADALLVLQAANCNDQVPAKLYEYLRAGRPVLALTDPAGDTAAVLRHAGLSAIARLDQPADIAELLLAALPTIRQGTHATANAEAVRAASRLERTRDLAELLDLATAHAPAAPKEAV